MCRYPQERWIASIFENFQQDNCLNVSFYKLSVQKCSLSLRLFKGTQWWNERSQKSSGSEITFFSLEQNCWCHLTPICTVQPTTGVRLAQLRSSTFLYCVLWYWKVRPDSASPVTNKWLEIVLNNVCELKYVSSLSVWWQICHSVTRGKMEWWEKWPHVRCFSKTTFNIRQVKVHRQVWTDCFLCL